MVVRIRLSRLGCRNKPFYRVMAADSRSPRDGKHLQVLGYYNPLPGKDGGKRMGLDFDRVNGIPFTAVGGCERRRVRGAVAWEEAAIELLKEPGMAISTDLKVLAGAFPPHPNQPSRPALHQLSCSSAFSSSKVKFGSIHGGRSNCLDVTNNLPQEIGSRTCRSGHQCSGVRNDSLFPAGINQETEGFILNAVRMNFFERLSLAWRILFPTAATRRNSNANIAKQRLKMILFSDRCAVSDEAKQKIVSNIVGALSDFVEIDSEDKVQLSVSADPDLGTIYSITVPVRRVKPGFQDSDEYKGITNIEYRDTGEESGTVDVRFDFFVP